MAAAEEKAGGPRRLRNGWVNGAWLNGLLVLLFSLLSLWLADLAFRAYERHFLLPQYPAIEADEPVNLAQLSYNDGVVERRTPDGEFRILSFGDSFTHSIMEPQLSYNGIVQQQLDMALNGRQARVVNLGEPGTGPNSFRAAHAYWSQVFEHDAVLFHIFLGNDVQDDAYLQSPLAWEPNIAVLQATNAYLDAGSKRVPHEFPLRMLDYAWAAWLSHRTTAAAALPPGYNWAALTELDDTTFMRAYFQFLDVADPEKLPALVPGYQQVALLLQQARRIALSGVKVAVVLGPSEPMVNDSLRAEVFSAAGARPQDYELGLAARIIGSLQQQYAPEVPLLDLTAAFRTRHQQTGEKLYFRHNTHWDEAGNRLAGDEIAAFLQQQWFNPGAEANGTPAPKPGAAFNEAHLLSDAGIRQYVLGLFSNMPESPPVVSGAARSLQLFDGIIGDNSNWAMAELGQAIELSWNPPVPMSELRIYFAGGAERSYGLLLEALIEDEWRVIADRRNDPVFGILNIRMPGSPVQLLRLTGTSNSDQQFNPANHFIHIEEIEWDN
jgi:hypothetical protein